MNQKELCQNCTEIDALGDKVYVTWWDKGSDGTDTPLLRISDDRGQTFGDIITVLTAKMLQPPTQQMLQPPTQQIHHHPNFFRKYILSIEEKKDSKT